MNKRQGEEKFVWWHGVVEDINDPLQIGRYRVRIFGYHTPNKSAIKTSDLPWASTVQSITSAAASGIGRSPTGLLAGSHVFGFFKDGTDAQLPVILGALAGIPESESNPQFGFNDPSGQIPNKSETESGNSVVGESDVSRLARNANTENTIVQKKKDSVKKSIQKAGGSSWEEPTTPYAAIYPNNHVFQSLSGHVCEFDDTQGAERIHVYHKSGTFLEIHPDGSLVEKIQKDRYQVILGDDYVSVSGNVSVTVEGDASIKVLGNTSIESDGDVKAEVKKNLTATVEQEAKIESKTIVLDALESIKLDAKNEIVLKTGGSTITINTTGIRLNAPGIDLN